MLILFDNKVPEIVLIKPTWLLNFQLYDTERSIIQSWKQLQVNLMTFVVV